MVVSEKEVDEEILKESKDKTEDYRKLKYYQVFLFFMKKENAMITCRNCSFGNFSKRHLHKREQRQEKLKKEN